MPAAGRRGEDGLSDLQIAGSLGWGSTQPPHPPTIVMFFSKLITCAARGGPSYSQNRCPMPVATNVNVISARKAHGVATPSTRARPPNNSTIGPTTASAYGIPCSCILAVKPAKPISLPQPLRTKIYP